MKQRQINLFADKKYFRARCEALKEEARQVFGKCLWSSGSTNPITGKSEMPQLCKDLKCDGINKPEECNNYEVK